MSKFWHFKELSNHFKNKEEQIQCQQSSLLLPNQIGCKIIEMEMQTMQAENLNKQIIMNLLSEYNKAIQFYEERGSQKYLFYQKKLQHFILRPSVAEVLQGKICTFLLKKQKNEQQLKKVKLHSHLQVKKILQNSQHSGKKQQQIIRNQLQSQQKNLEDRITRKRAMSNQAKRQKVTTASFSIPNSQKQISNQSPDIHKFISEFNQVPSPLYMSDSKANSRKLAF